MKSDLYAELGRSPHDQSGTSASARPYRSPRALRPRSPLVILSAIAVATKGRAAG